MEKSSRNCSCRIWEGSGPGAVWHFKKARHRVGLETREWMRMRLSSPSALHKGPSCPSPTLIENGNFLRALYRSGWGDVMAELKIKVKVCVLRNEASSSCSHGFL